MQTLNKKGLMQVLVSYLAWGFLPLFWKLLDDVPSFYILFSRVLWSLIFCLVYLTVLKKWDRIIAIFRDKNVVKRCALSGLFICINWGGYIWGVNNGHLLDCSLGYYLNPILNVILGMVFFKERLKKNEWIAVIMASIGVLFVVVRSGSLPLLSLLLAGSFGTYGMIKKGLTLESEESLFMETFLFLPVAMIFLGWSEINGNGAIGVLSGAEWLLLPIAGVITAIPLLMYSAGVQKIPFYMAGLIMYLNPTIQFFLGVLVFKEELNVDRLICFAFIWIGILIMVLGNRRKEA